MALLVSSLLAGSMHIHPGHDDAAAATCAVCVVAHHSPGLATDVTSAPVPLLDATVIEASAVSPTSHRPRTPASGRAPPFAARVSA